MTIDNKVSDDLSPRGPILARHLTTVPDFQYLVRLSANPDPRRVLVVVHGISRRAPFMMRCLASGADASNYTLIAPVFNSRSYSDYQRLGRNGRGLRADRALKAMLLDVQRRSGLGAAYHLFGFSGGAQFAHRYAYANPGEFTSLSLASAGWYTAPDPRVRYPYGTMSTRRLQDIEFRVNGVVDTPSLLMVGAADNERDDAVRQNSRLDQLQGQTRLARARWFHRQLVSHARKTGGEVPHLLKILPNTAHDFGDAVVHGGLSESLFQFCEECQVNDASEEII